MKPPALIISSDTSMFDASGDAVKRMEEYTKLYESVHVLVAACNLPSTIQEVRPHVFVHPVSYTNKVFGLVRLFRYGKKLVTESRFGTIYAQDPFWFGLVALYLSRRFNIPCAVGVYGMDIKNLFFAKEAFVQRIAMKIAPFVSRHADAIQTDGPETVEYLTRRYGAKVFFKPMFPANRKELKDIVRHVPERPFKLLFVGRFAMQKNLPMLLDVMTEAVKRLGNTISLTVVGGGMLKPMFFKGVKERGLENNVIDAGVLDRQQILDAYASHHALILTSYDEGFPRVFMEAALAGMPIITSEVGGVKDLVIDGVTGYVFPQGTVPGMWAETIASLVLHPEKIEGMSGALRAQLEHIYGEKNLLDYQRPLAEFLDSKRNRDI